jgi:hypothetical protein
MAKANPEYISKIRSETAKRRWADPAFKAWVCAKVKQTKARNGLSEETRRKMSNAAKKRFQNPEYRKQQSERVKAYWQNPEYRNHQSAVHKDSMAGEKHPMFGRHHSEEARKKIRENRRTPQIPPMLGKTHSEASRKKMSGSHKNVPLSKKHRESIGKASKRVWAGISEEKKNEWQGKIRKSLQCFPNKPETAILSALDSLYPGEWKFVGDGQVIIAGKNPDFINVNGQKKIIELFGDYWHRGEKAEDRAAIFSPFGYQTLVIWESELKDAGLLINKIRDFSENHHGQ